MKQGDIIRKRLSTGEPFGPYLIVKRAARLYVEAITTAYTTDEAIILPKDRIVLIPYARMPISRDILNMIELGKRNVVSFPKNSSRARALMDKQIELILLYSQWDRNLYKVIDIEELDHRIKVWIGESIF